MNISDDLLAIMKKAKVAMDIDGIVKINSALGYMHQTDESRKLKVETDRIIQQYLDNPDNLDKSQISGSQKYWNTIFAKNKESDCKEHLHIEPTKVQENDQNINIDRDNRLYDEAITKITNIIEKYISPPNNLTEEQRILYVTTGLRFLSPRFTDASRQAQLKNKVNQLLKARDCGFTI